MKSMKEMFANMTGRLGDLLISDEQSYAIAPPNGNTSPRSKVPPTTQATPASKWDTSLGPNPQSGNEMISVVRRNRFTKEQEYASYFEGPPISSGMKGEPDPVADTGIYIKDERVPNVDDTGKNDFQSNPHGADPENSQPNQGFGYPVVFQTGAESFFDYPNGMVDRDTTEVNTPTIQPDQSRYQASPENVAESPPWLLGASAFAPVQSLYPSDRSNESDKEHDQIWRQSHPNQVAHTHEEEQFGHMHFTPLGADMSMSVGNEGTDRLVTQGRGPITRIPQIPNMNTINP